MKIIPKAPIGAEVEDFLIKNTSSDEAKQLKQLLAKHGVLIFRNQFCSDGVFVDFLEKMGPLTFTVGETPVEGHADLNVVSNVGRKTKPVSCFHIDSSYFKAPPAYSALRAVTLPPMGGETLFTNQYWAFETLPKSVKNQLLGRTLHHVVTRLNLSDHQDAETEAHHPVFKEHPISQKTALYLSTPQRCVAASGLSDELAQELITACYEHSIQPENIYRHQWQAGDVVIWDNGCTLHRADHSQVNGNRVLHRGLSLGYNYN
ncbi:MAG: TauD/TfdA family dioxygenase [Bacteroidota bacterium]